MKTLRYSWMLFAMLVALITLATLNGPGSEAFQGEPTLTATITPPPTNTPRPTFTPSPPALTLVPPTPLPTMTPTPYNPPNQSGLAVAQNIGRLRVGTYYNAQPFAWLNEFGEVTGYEVDIVEAIAIELGVTVEFTQVTRQNADEMLLGERVDLLIGQQTHSRDREDRFDFTHPYFVNEQKMVVLADSAYQNLSDLAGRNIAVAIGTPSERALRNWSQQTGTPMNILTFFTEDSALDALAAGDAVDGMVGPRISLSRAGRQGMRFITDPILSEPHAITVRRWDANLLNLLNRSLQRMKASGRLDEIHRFWFPNQSVDFTTLVPVYDSLYEDARGLDDFPIDMPYPAAPVTERIAAGQPVRVAGLIVFEQDAPAQIRITQDLNQVLINEMARRWGIQIEAVPNSTANAVDLVANGQADIAVGVSPRWDGADRVEYSQPYARHGDRLMVPANETINTFADMLGTGWWIGYFADDSLDADNIVKFANALGVGQNIRDPFAIQREDDAIYTMVAEDNIDAIYGDNLRLLALIRDGGYENQVKILDTPYGDDMPIAFAMPRNDADFRALVNNTLQDMVLDGTYQRFYTEHFGLDDPVRIAIWPETGAERRLDR